MADALDNRSRSPYGRRFLLANAFVVLGFASVIVLFAFLVSRNSSSQAWSQYKPKGSDPFDKAQNMADHVAPKYKYQGAPIAVVQAQPLLYRDAIVDGIAFTRPPLRQVGGRLTQFEPSGSTIAYVFCGQAQKCALPQVGADEVVPLIQRESLELALYTFKYWPDVRSVVSLLPSTGNTSAAIYLKRSHVQRMLDRPLAASLPNHGELTASSFTDSERSLLESVVVRNTFQSRFEQVANGRTVLVLTAVNQ